MAWKKGPLPPNTWNWGAVAKVAADQAGENGGFLFASFCGDHVICYPGGETLKAEEVGWYTNDIEMPPTIAGVKGRTNGP